MLIITELSWSDALLYSDVLFEHKWMACFTHESVGFCLNWEKKKVAEVALNNS